MSTNFESFKELCPTINFIFSIVCFSKTSVGDKSFSRNSNFKLLGYKVLHQSRKNCKRGGVCSFMDGSLSFKLREDLSINYDAIQSLSNGISSNKFRNIIINTI